MEKECSKCLDLKPVTEFYKAKKNKDGYHGVCKICYDKRMTEFKLKNPAKYKSYNKKYNDSVINEHKEYYQNNKERIIERTGLYYKNVVKPNITEEDKERGRQRSNKYRKNNPDKMKEQYIKQKEYKKQWEKDKSANDPLFKLKRNIRALIGISIRRGGYAKNSKTIEILGCSFEEFKAHIELHWESWMSWDNHGLYEKDKFNVGWDVDHVIPVSSALNEIAVMKLNHYSNLKPLCSKINRDVKRDNI